MRTLEFLDMSGNLYGGIGTGILGGLANLTFLGLEKTKIHTLPTDLKNLQKLQLLILRGTDLLTLPPPPGLSALK